MYKFLPVILILTVILAVILFDTVPVKRFIVYNLGISGDSTISCCKEADVERSTGEFEESASVAFFNSQLVDYPKTSLAQVHLSTPDNQVLGTTNTAGEEKWIEVSLEQQMLRAWEGNNIVKEFPISSGKWGATPKGTFYIWYKTRFQRMTGGVRELGTFYDLPNVPYNMFFHKGFALHGAYWHNNFGTPMSHGCVNEPIAYAQELFDWAGPVVPENRNYVKASADNPGTKVFVH